MPARTVVAIKALMQNEIQVLTMATTDLDQLVTDWPMCKLATGTSPVQDCDHEAGRHGRLGHE